MIKDISDFQNWTCTYLHLRWSSRMDHCSIFDPSWRSSGRLWWRHSSLPSDFSWERKCPVTFHEICCIQSIEPHAHAIVGMDFFVGFMPVMVTKPSTSIMKCVYKEEVFHSSWNWHYNNYHKKNSSFLFTSLPWRRWKKSHLKCTWKAKQEHKEKEKSATLRLLH